MKKTVLYLILTVIAVFSLPTMAQNRQNQTYLNYISQYKDMAIK